MRVRVRVRVRVLCSLFHINAPLFSSPLSLPTCCVRLQGIHTIAAFQKQDAFMHKLMNTLDNHTKCFFFFHCSSRWFAFRLDYTTAVRSPNGW